MLTQAFWDREYTGKGHRHSSVWALKGLLWGLPRRLQPWDERPPRVGMYEGRPRWSSAHFHAALDLP